MRVTSDRAVVAERPMYFDYRRPFSRRPQRHGSGRARDLLVFRRGDHARRLRGVSHPGQPRRWDRPGHGGVYAGGRAGRQRDAAVGGPRPLPRHRERERRGGSRRRTSPCASPPTGRWWPRGPCISITPAVFPAATTSWEPPRPRPPGISPRGPRAPASWSISPWPTPATATALVTVEYMLGDGQGDNVMQQWEVPARSRVTVSVNDAVGAGEGRLHARHLRPGGGGREAHVFRLRQRGLERRELRARDTTPPAAASEPGSGTASR